MRDEEFIVIHQGKDDDKLASRVAANTPAHAVSIVHNHYAGCIIHAIIDIEQGRVRPVLYDEHNEEIGVQNLYAKN